MRVVVFSLALVLFLVLSLAGGCVPTVIAEDASPTAQAAPAGANFDDPQELARFLDALIAERMEDCDIPGEAVRRPGWGGLHPSGVPTGAWQGERTTLCWQSLVWRSPGG